MRYRVLSTVFLLAFGHCSSGGYVPHDGAGAGTDSSPGDLATDLPAITDLPGHGDASGGCVTSFSCAARTAEHGCGVTTVTGQRYPDLGAPYCPNKTTRQGCSCDLVRCTTPLLCPGTYQAVFNERLIAGCSGIVNVKSGSCTAVWNTVQSSPDAAVLADRTLLNGDLDWDFADYQQAFKLTTAGVVKLSVAQNCWLADVSGMGKAGRSEVSKITVMAQ